MLTTSSLIKQKNLLLFVKIDADLNKQNVTTTANSITELAINFT